MHGTYVQQGRRRITQSLQHGNTFPDKEMYHAICSHCGLIDVSLDQLQAARAASDHKKKYARYKKPVRRSYP